MHSERQKKGSSVLTKNSLYHLVIGFMLLFELPLCAQETTLIAVLPIKPPIIANNRMVYVVDMLFSHCPPDCWSYYDAPNKRMTLEFYDSYILVPDIITIQGTSPVRKISVENSSTTVVLSGKQSQIHLVLNEEMHCITKCHNDTLRATLWKDLSPQEIVNQERKESVALPFLTAFISALLTITLLIYIL